MITEIKYTEDPQLYPEKEKKEYTTTCFSAKTNFCKSFCVLLILFSQVVSAFLKSKKHRG